MADAATEVLASMLRLARAGESTASAAVGRASAPRSWKHYPDGGVEDREAGCTWYYHSHERTAAGSGEHGHFHVFARTAEGACTHLAGLAVDARGSPVRLFATNRWVTDERWRDARTTLRLAARTRGLRAPGRSVLSRWLGATLELFRPQLAVVLEHRDQRIAQWRAGGRDARLLEDRRIHVLSDCVVSIENQLAALEAAA